MPGAPQPLELRTGGIFHEIADEDFYARLIETLGDAAGYTVYRSTRGIGEFAIVCTRAHLPANPY